MTTSGSEMCLTGHRVLVAENEYMLADDQCSALREAGALVLGPVGSVGECLDLISGADEIDAAILDINLRGEMIFPAADLLLSRGVPFVFTTGYDAEVIPARFAGVVRCEKPVDMRKVSSALARRLRNSITSG